jgi:EEF1A N-terminal glycine/lysine methyltransferase
MTSEDADLAGDANLFNEPDDYYPPEKPATFVEHTVQSGQKLRLRLVGHDPLWVGSDPLLAVRPTH